jgi:hypothetical protein
VRRDSFGDRDDQWDSGVFGFQDGVGGETRWHEHHRRVGLRLLHRFVEGVEDGDAVHVLAALAGRHARDDIRPIVAVSKAVEGAFAPRYPGDHQTGIPVHQDRH